MTSVAAVHLVLVAAPEEHRTQHCAPSSIPPECAELTVLLWQETHPQIQRFGDPLPTFDAFKAKSAKMQSKTVQDVWGLMLTSVPGESTFSEALSKPMTISAKHVVCSIRLLVQVAALWISSSMIVVIIAGCPLLPL